MKELNFFDQKHNSSLNQSYGKITKIFKPKIGIQKFKSNKNMDDNSDNSFNSSSSNSNLLNFYQQKKRVLVNESFSDDSYCSKSPVRKQIRKSYDIDKSVDIIWDDRKTNEVLDLKLNLKKKNNEVKVPNTQDIINSCKINEILTKFKAKLNLKNKEKKEEDSYKEFFDDEENWLNDLPKSLDQIISKESGIESYNSTGMKSENQDDFKIPNTPVKLKSSEESIKLFNSTPKHFPNNLKNQKNNFKTIQEFTNYQILSPIKFSNAPAVSIKTSNKNLFNDSSNKLNNSTIQNEKRKKLFINQHQHNNLSNNEIMEDSFDLIISQLNEDSILKKMNNEKLKEEEKNESLKSFQFDDDDSILIAFLNENKLDCVEFQKNENKSSSFSWDDEDNFIFSQAII